MFRILWDPSSGSIKTYFNYVYTFIHHIHFDMFRPISAELQQYLHLSSSLLYIAVLPDVSRIY